MAKDPAFLFYSGDFLIGISLLSEQEIGQYIKLLCHIHQQGHLGAEDVHAICPQISDKVLQKFRKDRAGKLYNERLEEEIKKRKLHSEKQRQNANKRWDKIGNKVGNAVALPLEDGNENGSVLGLGVRGKGRIDVPVEFGQAHELYPSEAGKNFVTTDFKTFKEEHKDWKELLPLLLPAIKRQYAYRKWEKEKRNFDRPWKRFSKWLKERGWEEFSSFVQVLEKKQQDKPAIPASEIFGDV